MSHIYLLNVTQSEDTSGELYLCTRVTFTWKHFIFFFIFKWKNGVISISRLIYTTFDDLNVQWKWIFLTLRLPSNSRNLMIPSRFCGCCCSVDGFVSEDPFVSAVDIVALCGDSIWSVFLIIWLVAACLNSLFNWNNEKFRRLSVVNLKTFNMFQLLLNRIFCLEFDCFSRSHLNALSLSQRSDFMHSFRLFVQFFAIMLTQML